MCEDTKIQCNECKQIFEVPNASCPLCFSNYLGRIIDQEDDSENSGKMSDLTILINRLCNFEYDRGLHNAKCQNQLEIEVFDSFKFTTL